MDSKLVFDLQFFAGAGEKTEKATPKKRREARKKGQVLKSQELSTALLILGVFITLHLSRGLIGEQMGRFALSWFGSLERNDLTVGAVSQLFVELSWMTVQIMVPISAAALIIGILSNFLQVGPFFQLDLIRPKMEKLNPISGFKRIFSTRSLAELVKSLLKIVIVGIVVYLSIRGIAPKLLSLWALDTSEALGFLETTIFSVAWRVGLALLVLGVFDYFYQRWEYERNLKMSKQEVKEEFKQTEGDPLIKSRIRQRARQMAMSRMMQAVPEADVVITNPTHIAVALKYQAESMEAPEVVAMGQGYLAEKIKTIARENKVAVVENKPLARALYNTAEIGEAIPADLYQAVAEVLAFVLRLRKKNA